MVVAILIALVMLAGAAVALVHGGTHLSDAAPCRQRAH